MLTRERISSLIRCELPDQEIRQILMAVNQSGFDLGLISSFIDCVSETCAFPVEHQMDVLDCSGTGGSGLPHYNTSTTVAFVLAAGGVKVAKFGNRAARSLSGSFDLLGALGIPTDIPFDGSLQILEQVGLVFLFAPQYYPHLARLAPIRKSLGGTSIFNAIGPLLHPYKPTKRVMGTSIAGADEIVADYLLADSTTRRAIVVRSESGLDEFDPCDDSHYFEIDKRMHDTAGPTMPIKKRDLVPARSTERPSAAAMDAEHNYKIFLELLAGTAPTYFTELVCLNAGAGFKVWGSADSIEDGAALAKQLFDDGSVAAKYEESRRAYAGFLK